MDIKVSNIQDNSLQENEIEVIVKSPNINKSTNDLIEYIKQYNEKSNKTIMVNNDSIIKEISYDDVMML